MRIFESEATVSPIEEEDLVVDDEDNGEEGRRGMAGEAMRCEQVPEPEYHIQEGDR